jgi:hypothetical protein
MARHRSVARYRLETMTAAERRSYLRLARAQHLPDMGIRGRPCAKVAAFACDEGLDRHIGMGKAGTSSVQFFLRDNWEHNRRAEVSPMRAETANEER